jgi:hypothetical protein
MESFKQTNEKNQGQMRPHGGYRSRPFKIEIPKKKVKEEEEKEEPITPGSIHSAWTDWYISPFHFEDDDYVDHFKPLEDVDYDGEYY